MARQTDKEDRQRALTVKLLILAGLLTIAVLWLLVERNISGFGGR